MAPQSVAVIGASTTPGKVGHDNFVNILKGGFTGTLYPVNPTARSISSVRAYASIKDVPDQLDLAIVILPPQPALQAVQDAVAQGVKGLVIVSAGFREVGAEGLEIENRIVSVCREAGVRLIGPNCLGVINPPPALGVIGDAFACYDPIPFGLVEDDFVNYAMAQFAKRFERLEKARGQMLDEINHAARQVIETEDA